MEMADHTFCRLMLRDTMKEVRSRVPKAEIKTSWAWHRHGDVEFHGPGNFYWHGQGCCAWIAKAEGWQAYLMHLDEQEARKARAAGWRSTDPNEWPESGRFRTDDKRF